MALQATHMRAALDVQGDIGATDIASYLSGTIYPDSRYLTKLDRTITHNISTARAWGGDFGKGWEVHLLVDEIQNKLHKRHLKHLFSDNNGDDWIVFSAIKTVQDMEDSEDPRVGARIDLLSHVEAPCGESIERMKEYGGIVQKLYERKGVPTPEDYRQFASAMQIEARYYENFIGKAIEYLQQPELVKAIRLIYPQTVELLRAQLAIDKK